MRKKVILAFLAAALLFPAFLFAAQEGDGICTAVKETIQDGKDSKVVVRTAIELGHSPCLIVQCALDGGGEPERVIAGAIEAGTATDVVSRCAVDGGLDPSLAAAILAETDVGLSLCYFEPEGAEFREPPGGAPARDPFPRDDGQRGPVISPFSF